MKINKSFKLGMFVQQGQEQTQIKEGSMTQVESAHH